MTQRRGQGEGAVYRRADGMWVGAVELGRDAKTGRRRRKVVKARTKAAVLGRIAEARRDVEAGRPVTDERRTTGDYLRWWACEILPGTVKETTEGNYRWIIEHYLLPSLEAVPLGSLAPAHVQRMLRQLENQGKSARTRQYARAVLRRALAHAERWDLVRRNAAALVEPPRNAGAKLHDALTAAEAQRVLDAAGGDRLEAVAVLALTLGLRRGEIVALRWEHVDFDARTLRVEQTVSRLSGKGLVVTTPKTEAGARTLPMVDAVRDALTQRRSVQLAERDATGSAWTETGYIFTSEIGTLLDPANVLHWWYALTERAGVGRRRLHASRHTAATLMLEQGVPLEIVSAVLGHAGLAITADIYARPGMDAKRRALANLATSMSGPSATECELEVQTLAGVAKG